jgi:hypothetical protein
VHALKRLQASAGNRHIDIFRDEKSKKMFGGSRPHTSLFRNILYVAIKIRRASMLGFTIQTGSGVGGILGLRLRGYYWLA